MMIIMIGALMMDIMYKVKRRNRGRVLPAAGAAT